MIRIFCNVHKTFLFSSISWQCWFLLRSTANICAHDKFIWCAFMFSISAPCLPRYFSWGNSWSILKEVTQIGQMEFFGHVLLQFLKFCALSFIRGALPSATGSYFSIINLILILTFQAVLRLGQSAHRVTRKSWKMTMHLTNLVIHAVCGRISRKPGAA